VAGGRVIVLAQESSMDVTQGAQVLVSDPAGSAWRNVELNDSGRPIVSGFLIPVPGDVLIDANGLARDSSRGPHGPSTMDLSGSGQVHPLPGIPLRGGDAFRLEPGPDVDQEFVLEWISEGDGTEQRPVRIDVQAPSAAGSRLIPGVVSMQQATHVGADVVVFVQLSPARSPDAARYGGGRWLFRVGPSPLLWERFPSPEIPDEPEHRNIAVGPDGSIYLMLAWKEGMEILRRPRP